MAVTSPQASNSFDADDSNLAQDLIVDVIKWFKEELELDYQDISESLGVEYRTLLNWRQGDSPKRDNKLKLFELHKLRQHLISTFPDPGLRIKWFNKPSPNLYGDKGISGELPYVLFLEGDYEKIINELTAIRSGSYV